MEDAAAFVQQVDAVFYLLPEHVHAPFGGEGRKLFARFQIVFHFLEYPRPSEAGAAYHDGVHTVALETLEGTLRGGDVAVTDDGDVYARILLHLADEGPVGFARVHLRAGTAMDGQGADAAILQLLGQGDDNFVFGIPAEAGFHGDGYLHRVDHGAGDFVVFPEYRNTHSAFIADNYDKNLSAKENFANPANYDFTRDANALEFMKLCATQSGSTVERIILFANSPHYLLTVSGKTNGDYAYQSNLPAENYEAYCEYLINYLDYVVNGLGLTVDAVSAINEPQHSWGGENSPQEVVETGSREEWCANNIYDFAGNVDEWTQEQNESSCRVIRGGDCFSYGCSYPVAYRNYFLPNINYFYTGFRATLYIK